MKSPTRLFQPGARYARYTEMVEQGTTLAMVMSPDYWTHVRAALRVHDVIECIAMDGSFEVDLRVTQIRDTYPTFRVIREFKGEPGSSVASKADRYETQQIGKGIWGVVEKSTGKRIAEGFDKAGADAERRRLEDTRVAA